MLPHEDLSLDHRAGRHVKAQRLYLQPAVAEPGLTVAALEHFICIDIEATQNEEVTKSEVVASHRRVMAQIECFDISTAESSFDEAPGVLLIEQDPPEPLGLQLLPAPKALADICGKIAPIVPKL